MSEAYGCELYSAIVLVEQKNQDTKKLKYSIKDLLLKHSITEYTQ